MPSSFSSSVCAQCKAPNATLLCPKCSCVAYCNADCQAGHWRNGGHSRNCLELAKDRYNELVQGFPGGVPINYLMKTFFKFDADEEVTSRNLSWKQLADLKAFQTVALTVATYLPVDPSAVRYYILTFAALTHYTLVRESKVASSSLSSSSSSWHPLLSLTRYLEAFDSMQEMPEFPEHRYTLTIDKIVSFCSMSPLRTSICILRKQGRKKETAALAIHVLAFVERSKIVLLPFKVFYVTEACD